MSDLLTELTSSRTEHCDLLDRAPRIDAGQADLSRLLGRGLRIALPGPGRELLALPATASAATNTQPSLRLLLAQGPVLLAQGERLLAGLTGIDPASTRGADGNWPLWLVGALAGRLQHTPLAALQSIQVSQGAVDEAGMVALQLRLRDGEHAIETTAWAGVSVWRNLLDGAEPQRMPASRWLPIACSSVVSLASHRLSHATFEGLRMGDLILPDRPLFDIDGTGRVVVAAQYWRVRYVDHQRLQILSKENALNYETDPDEALDDACQGEDQDGPPDPAYDHAGDGGHESNRMEGADGDVSVPGEIRLTLRFELGRLKLSLDQLRALGEQAVLTLHDASAQSIAITSSGTEVGRGEVVSVDGRLGVRITRWSGAC